MATNNYSISFKSLRTNTVYTLNIGGGSGTAIALKGGAQPFTTQENEEDDMFAPIRTQSGFIRIVDDGYDADGNVWNWKDLIPDTDTSRPVTLTHMVNGSPVVDWTGFMQAQTFSGVLYGNPQERDFPVQCPLSVTGCTDINYQQTAIQNFAYLLKQVIDSIPSDQRPTEMMIQGGELARTMLMTMVDWQNFTNEGDDDTMEARYSMMECLEDMCRYWGWTARIFRRTLYLTCADDADMQNFLSLDTTSLATLAGGSSAGTVTNVTFLSASISSGFASTENEDITVRGYNRAEVQANINSASGNIIKTDTDLIYRLLTAAGWQNVVESSDGVYRYTVDQLTLNHPTLTFACTDGNATLNYAQLYDKEKNQKAEVSMIRIKKSYNNVTPTVHASIELKYEHCYSKNWIELHGVAYRLYERLDTTTEDTNLGQKHMHCRIGIKKTGYPTMWLQPDGTWANRNMTIQLTIGNGDDKLWFYNPNAANEPITVERREIADNLSGTLFIEFLGSSDLPADSGGQRSFDIAEFGVVMYHGDIAEYAYQNHYWWKFENAENVKQTISYKAKNQNIIKADFNADVIFASDNNVIFGYGLLSNPDRSYFKGIQYVEHGPLVFPEQHLADRVVVYCGKSRRMLGITMKSNVYVGAFVGDLSPRYVVTIDYMLGHIVAISRDWRDDVVKLSLLEMPTQ